MTYMIAALERQFKLDRRWLVSSGPRNEVVVWRLWRLWLLRSPGNSEGCCAAKGAIGLVDAEYGVVAGEVNFEPDAILMNVEI